jgi:hypothetical protein
MLLTTTTCFSCTAPREYPESRRRFSTLQGSWCCSSSLDECDAAVVAEHRLMDRGLRTRSNSGTGDESLAANTSRADELRRLCKQRPWRRRRRLVTPESSRVDFLKRMWGSVMAKGATATAHQIVMGLSTESICECIAAIGCLDASSPSKLSTPSNGYPSRSWSPLGVYGT